jgi:hypothetical protein
MTTFFGVKSEGESYKAGIQIPVDLGFLIENVVVSPYASRLLSDVKDLLLTNGLHKPVSYSLL